MAKKIDHSSRQHALLSASGSHRWLSCPPSARLEEQFEKFYPPTSSVYAEEGTLAHEFCDVNLRYLSGCISEKEYGKLTGPLRAHDLYDPDMEDQVLKYTNYVMESFAEAQTRTKDAILFIEQQLDFSHVVEEGFGTGDSGIIADGVMEMIDFKYGKGVKVDAIQNPQLMLYAIGALKAYELMYDIHTVKLTIVQPRMDNICSWEISVEELLKWAEDVVKPTAAKAYEGKGLQKAGDHCKFCKVKAMCNTLAQKNIALAKGKFEEPQTMSDDRLIEVYKQLPMLVDWANSVSEYLYNKARSGEKIRGFKMVKGQSKRQWNKGEEEAIAKILSDSGFDRGSFIKESLKGIGDIEKLLGKDRFKEQLSSHISTVDNAPLLVPESDKRPAINACEQAKSDFKD